jgi:hypothetical protein
VCPFKGNDESDDSKDQGNFKEEPKTLFEKLKKACIVKIVPQNETFEFSY